MTTRLRVLIVGGYGTFGGRLVELLEDETRLTMVVAGRSLGKAQAFCAARQPKAALVAERFDRDADVPAQLVRIAPDLVVDASGPFQAYGERPYRLVEACIEARVHYLDLADGVDFVDGVGDFDSAAKTANIFILSGVSSFPVLTAAVVRYLGEGLELTSIHGGIAPSPYAGVGGNVIRAIASYSGKPIQLTRYGGGHAAYGFTEQQRYTIAPPGRLPLRSTLFSLVDVPDLRVLPRAYRSLGDIWMGAGPVPESLHRVLIALAWLVRWRLLPSLLPFARLMQWATERLRWGEHRGGMYVEVQGRDAASANVCRSWHLLAEGSDGPRIPSMAAEAIIRNLLAERMPLTGARAATDALSLVDYDERFASRTIYTGVRDETGLSDKPLYRRLLNAAYETLPAVLQGLHDISGPRAFHGKADVTRGEHPVGRFVAQLFGFPRAASDADVYVTLAPERGGERWTRQFGRTSFSSWQGEGSGRSSRLLRERFGPLVFDMALVVDGAVLRLILRRWSILRLPLPMWLAPRADAYETIVDGRFNFHVDLALPLVGRIVRYTGWLEPTQIAGCLPRAARLASAP